MNPIHLYHIEYKNLGHDPTINPKIPYHRAFDEDSTTPRICCCTTITNCIEAMEIIPERIAKNSNSIELFVYEAYVPVENIYFPTIDEVPDVWKTGEVWVLDACTFYMIKHYKAYKSFDIPNTCYSKYCFYSDDGCIVPDRVLSPIIYGDMDSFCMTMMNPYQYAHNEAMIFYSDNPYF